MTVTKTTLWYGVVITPEQFYEKILGQSVEKLAEKYECFPRAKSAHDL